MAPIPYPFDYEESPTGFPSLLRRVWLFFCTRREKTRHSRCTARSWLISCTSTVRRCSCSRAPRLAVCRDPRGEDSRLLQSRPFSMLHWRLLLICVTMRSGCSSTQVFLITLLCLLPGRFFFRRTQRATGRQCTSLAIWSLSMSWSLVLLRSWLVPGNHSRPSAAFSRPS